MILTELIAQLTDQLAHHGGDVKVVASRDLGYTDIAGVDENRIDTLKLERWSDEDIDSSETVVVIQTG